MERTIKRFYLVLAIGLLLVGGWLMLSPWSGVGSVVVGIVIVMVSVVGYVAGGAIEDNNNEGE